MLYREIIAVCSEIHTKHINTLCGQNVQLLYVKLAVHIVITLVQTAKCCNRTLWFLVRTKEGELEMKS